MKIVIYLGHPAQYHFFKNAISILKARKHKVALLIRTKDILEDLLKYNQEEYTNILKSGRKDNRLGMLLGLLRREIRLYIFMLKSKPDIVLGTDPALAHISKILHVPCITCLEDDYDVIPNLARITYPFTKSIFAPNVCGVGKWEHKKIGYDGYMKLAYLHPNYFKPDRKIVGPFTSERYFLIRLAKLTAHHDFNIKGFNKDLLLKVIDRLSTAGRVYISSEYEIDEIFKKFQIDIHPIHIHHFIYYADLLVSDSQSMSVEAAVLGTPSIRFSDFSGKISVLEELEHKFHLTFGIKPAKPEALLDKIDELLKLHNMDKQWQIKRKEMMRNKIDVTDCLVRLIEGYSEDLGTNNLFRHKHKPEEKD